jgi:hypothetical protein
VGNNEKDTVTFIWPGAEAYGLKTSTCKTLLTCYSLGISLKCFAVEQKWFDFFGKYLVSKAFWLSDSWLAKLFFTVSIMSYQVAKKSNVCCE